MRASWCLLVLVVAACSGASRGPSALEQLRRQVRERPADATARRDRALAELVAPGGDLALATREIAALARETPHDPRVHFAAGVLAAQHGEFDAAATALLAALDAARTADDPLGPVVAEAAVSRLVALRGDVRDFVTPFHELVERVQRDPGRLGAAARGELVETAVRWARERGDRDAVARWTEAAGCVTAWTLAGPFGPLPMLRFDEHLPPEGAGPLAAAYELGPGRGRRPTYTVRARGCAANLGRGETLVGVLYAATDVVLDRDADVLLHAESPNVFAVLVDGVTVGTIDPRRIATGSVANVALHLASGRHTLRVKVASRYHSPLLVVTLTDLAGRPVGRFLPAGGGAHESAPVLLDAAGSVPPGVRPDDPFARYALAELAFSRREVIGARELLRPLVPDAHAAPVTLVAWGSIALADPFLPTSQSRDRARRAFEQAAGADPRAYYPALQLARLAGDDGRDDEALDLVREAARRFPDNAEIEADLAERLLNRNWDGEARAVLEHALRRLPDACWHVRLLFTLAQRHADGTAERTLAEGQRRCDALSDSAASTLVRLRRWGEAETEYTRLLADDPEGRGLRRALVETARARGHSAEAARRARALLADMPEDTALREDLADLETAAGRWHEARALLDRELARAPAELAGLYRMRALLARQEELEPWRLDGPQVLRDFAASGHRYDSAAVLVLDYTVRRNFPDGSALELTHNVIQVQSQEGVDAYGEFTPPRGAVLWRVRTLKADGRLLEAETVAGKDSLSLPDLRPGDALEFEHLRALPTTDAAPGGFLADRFYFRGFEIPYDRSEYVVIAPREMELRIDPRGPAPVLQRTDRGALIEYRWVAHQSDRMTPEPRSIEAREFIPSIALGAGATWERFVNALRERLVDLDPLDPEAVRVAQRAVQGARRPSQRLAQLHRWVTEHIQQEGSGTPFESAPRMLAARAGHRTRVLCYLLRLVDVPCTMALIRQGNADATASELADDGTFQSIMLQVRTEQGLRWVTAADHNAPVDYLPPALAGSDGLLLAAGAPRVRLPPLDLSAHGRNLRVALALQPDGAGRARVEERLRGYAATSAREALRRIDVANRHRQFESYVGSLVAGASVEAVQIEGVEDPGADLVFRYTFTAPGLANASRGRLFFDGIFHAEAARVYGETPERSVPLWNSDPIHAALDLDVTLPPGATLETLPPAAEGRAAGVSWSLRWERTAQGFRELRRVDLPTGRVTVADYPAFAASVRALDRADTLRVAAALP